MIRPLHKPGIEPNDHYCVKDLTTEVAVQQGVPATASQVSYIEDIIETIEGSGPGAALCSRQAAGVIIHSAIEIGNIKDHVEELLTRITALEVQQGSCATALKYVTKYIEQIKASAQKRRILKGDYLDEITTQAPI